MDLAQHVEAASGQRWAAQGSSEPELAGQFEFPALPSVVSGSADDEQYHGEPASQPAPDRQRYRLLPGWDHLG